MDKLDSDRKLRKITFLTGHSWKSKRLGGFHKFAEAACAQGAETVFFSFPRPYYGLLMHQELFNAKAIRELQKGVSYTVEGSTLHNVTFATLKLPNVCRRFLTDGMMNALERFSFTPFSRFARRWLDGTDVFVFESADGIIFIDRLKKRYPQAKFVYRPSDPLMYDGALSRYERNERHIMEEADLSIVVNEEGLALYRRKIPGFDARIPHVLLSNGVDIEPYTKEYPAPELLRGRTTLLYVGAWAVEWPLLCRAADECPDCDFVVVCPNYPDAGTLQEAESHGNLHYVPGIPPEEVPAWITNCTAVMVPYVTGFYKNRPLGITAKYYQAMAARKPIVAYCDTPRLEDAGVSVTYTYEEFIAAAKRAVQQKECSYAFDLAGRDWGKITRKFMELLEDL